MLNTRKDGLCLFDFFFKEIIGYHVYSECYVLLFYRFQCYASVSEAAAESCTLCYAS